MSDSFNQQKDHLNKQIQQQQQHHTHKLFTNQQQQRKRYSCDQCSYSTDRRDLYRRHENIHKDEKPFRCYICNKMFNRADHVKKHFLRIHKGLEYNVKLIKRSNAVDYSSPPTLDTNQNGENCSILSDGIGNLTVDKIDSNNNNLTSGSFNCLTNLPIKSERSFFNNYQTVFPNFTNSVNSSQLQSHQRSLLRPLVKQHQQQSPTSSQRSLLKQSNPPSSPPPPSRSLLTLLQQHPPPSSSSSPSPPPPSTFSPSSSLLSSLTPSSPSAYNTNIDSDDDTTITTINHNNQIIIVICGKRNSNQKSIINHMLNSNGLKRCGKYSSSSSSIGLNTRKDKRKQNKPKRASIEAN